MTASSTATKPETKKYKFGVQKLLKRYNSFCLHVTLIIYNLQKCQLLYFFFLSPLLCGLFRTVLVAFSI